VFKIKYIEWDVTNGPVCVLDQPGRHKVVQVIRNRTEGNRFISGRRLVNFPSLREEGREHYLRLGIGTRELQIKHRELAPYFPEKPRVCGKTANEKDKLVQSHQRQLG